MHDVFDFVPERGMGERTLHDFIQLAAIAEAIELQPSSHVVVNRHRGEWVRLLKDHADAAADLHGGGSVVNVKVTDAHAASGASFGNSLVHAVEAAHECGLPTTGWADDRGGMIGRHVHADIVERLSFAEPGVQVLDLDTNTHQLTPLIMPRPAAMRTAVTETTVSIIRISPPDQDCRCHSSNGEMA